MVDRVPPAATIFRRHPEEGGQQADSSIIQRFNPIVTEHKNPTIIPSSLSPKSWVHCLLGGPLCTKSKERRSFDRVGLSEEDVKTIYNRQQSGHVAHGIPRVSGVRTELICQKGKGETCSMQHILTNRKKYTSPLSTVEDFLAETEVQLNV